MGLLEAEELTRLQWSLEGNKASESKAGIRSLAPNEMKNSFIPNTFPPPASGFTRVELLALMACLALLAITQLPSLGRSREGGHEAVCMNNMRQLGLAMLMYADENGDVVPEEGDTVAQINTTANADAWYNLAVLPGYPSLTNLYNAGTPPLPDSMSVYSCPSASFKGFPPSVAHYFFMYGENGRLCINKATRATGIGQTRFSSIPQPRDTVLMAEANDTNIFSISTSQVKGNDAIARHQGFGIFAMTDGHVRAAPSNEFFRTSSEANDAATEWATPRTMYWYPTPNTPN